MKKVECWKSDDGELHSSLDRAAANDLLYALPKSAVNPNAKVLDWAACRIIMENAELIAHHVGAYLEQDAADRKLDDLL